MKIQRLIPVYEWCAPNVVDRFGAETVIRKYNFTSSVKDITAARQSHCGGQHGGKGQPGAVKIEGGKHGSSHSQQQGQAIPALIAHG